VGQQSKSGQHPSVIPRGGGGGGGGIRDPPYLANQWLERWICKKIDKWFGDPELKTKTHASNGKFSKNNLKVRVQKNSLKISLKTYF
jgi:hypothetical protein